jgi:hypothetical protein
LELENLLQMSLKENTQVEGDTDDEEEDQEQQFD